MEHGFYHIDMGHTFPYIVMACTGSLHSQSLLNIMQDEAACAKNITAVGFNKIIAIFLHKYCALLLFAGMAHDKFITDTN